MPKKEQFYITGDDVIKVYARDSGDLDENEIIPRGKATTFQSIANRGRTFVGHDTNISVRSEYGRRDYEYFRSGESIPTNPIDIISMSMDAYYKVGIVRNIIDLMADFACQGIRFQHPRKTTENFYNKWFVDKVVGKEVSTKFLTMLLKAGTVIVKKSTGTVPVVDENEWKLAIQQDLKMDKVKFDRREIPLRYTFINPLSIEMVGSELANFVGKPILGLKIPRSIKSSLQRVDMMTDTNKAKMLRELIKSIPKDMLAALRSGANVVPLDMSKVCVYHYRKDDWMSWGSPMTASVLNDLIMLEKMKLADISALDGAISNIRLWRLGIIDGVNSILPTKSAINKLRNILANNVGGGVLDLVWGPELDFKESNSQVWRFLGSEKYEATLNSIYESFGIPSSLRSRSSNTNTGNFIGLNTLIKRLQYIRDTLISFWREQVTIIHKSMGFRGQPPRIIFDNMVLADEAAEKQLLLNMWDRDLISSESIQEIFGRVPEVEMARIKIETDGRGEEMPNKASPFHNANQIHELRKIILQAGDVTPSEVGLELDDKSPNQQSRFEKTEKMQTELKKLDIKNRPKPIINTKTGVPGRPSNITETKKRKPKPTEKPSTNASFPNIFIWANSAQEQISSVVMPALLNSFDKTNSRYLTKNETDIIEYIKFGILCEFKPFESLNKEKIVNSIANHVTPTTKSILVYNQLCSQFKSQYNRNPKLEEIRQLYSSTYSIINSTFI